MHIFKNLTIILVLTSIVGCWSNTKQPNKFPSLPSFPSSESTESQYPLEVQKLLDLHIRYRTENGNQDARLEINEKLMSAAQKHAEWMASNRTLSHKQGWLFGNTVSDRVEKENYNYRTVGENIAYGQKSPEEVMRAWMNSQGHRRNILGPYKEIGFGIATNNGIKYWCVVFGYRNKTAASEVIPDDEQVVANIKYIPIRKLGDGWEDRGEEYIRWLAPSVRVRGSGTGSGTIIYYDKKTKYCYVISCGHLFRGKSMTTEEGERRNTTAKVDVWYHNKEKLDKYKTYRAEVLCYQNFKTSVWDVSLLRFKTNDWEPDWYLPIAERDMELKRGDKLHSLGCDGGRRVARYEIEYIKERSKGTVTELVTHKNNPRGGRSGGGVFTEKEHLVAICSRGNGYAYWTSLDQIYKFLEKEEKWRWLLYYPRLSFVKKIPIIDRTGKREFSEDYIPLPR